MSSNAPAADARQPASPSPDGNALLLCTARVAPRGAVVTAVGEIDLSTAAQVDAQLDELSRAAPEHLILDLTGIRFMDSTGLALLVRWARRADEGGPRFSVVADGGVPQRVLTVSGVAGIVEQLPTTALATLA